MALECTWYFPKMRGTQYRPQNAIVLILGTPKMVPPILGNPHMHGQNCATKVGVLGDPAVLSEIISDRLCWEYVGVVQHLIPS